eukprot:COSAG01_NODE_39305_length_478_cov_0.957784_1_plen_22_part_01
MINLIILTRTRSQYHCSVGRYF